MPGENGCGIYEMPLHGPPQARVNIPERVGGLADPSGLNPADRKKLIRIGRGFLADHAFESPAGRYGRPVAAKKNRLQRKQVAG